MGVYFSTIESSVVALSGSLAGMVEVVAPALSAASSALEKVPVEALAQHLQQQAGKGFAVRESSPGESYVALTKAGHNTSPRGIG